MLKERISANKFIQTYVNGSSIKDVAKKLDISEAYVVSRAYMLRRNGNDIPRPSQLPIYVKHSRLDSLKKSLASIR